MTLVSRKQKRFTHSWSLKFKQNRMVKKTSAITNSKNMKFRYFEINEKKKKNVTQCGYILYLYTNLKCKAKKKLLKDNLYFVDRKLKANQIHFFISLLYFGYLMHTKSSNVLTVVQSERCFLLYLNKCSVLNLHPTIRM